jgi:hypothetical protein
MLNPKMIGTKMLAKKPPYAFGIKLLELFVSKWLENSHIGSVPHQKLDGVDNTSI